MNTALKTIIDKAIYYEKEREVRDAALDTIYEKLTLVPLQRAWRNKTAEQKKIISYTIHKWVQQTCEKCEGLTSKKMRGIGCCIECYMEKRSNDDPCDSYDPCDSS